MVRTTKRAAIVAGGVASLAVLAGCGSGASSSGEPGVSKAQILIGTDAPLTGPASSVGQGFKLGVGMAVAEINEHGGINGRKLKVVYEDDAGTSAGGVQAARRMVDQDDVFAVLSGASSSAAVAEVPYFKQSNVPFYVSLASDPRVSQPFNKYIFSGGTAPRPDVAPAIAKFLDRGLHINTLALLVDDEAQCQSGAKLLKSAVQKKGVRIVATQSFQLGDTDYTAQAAKLKGAGPDATYVCGEAADGARILTAFDRAGVPGEVVGDASMADPSFLKAAGPAAEGFYTFWTPSKQFVGDHTGVMGKWLDRVKETHPKLASDLPNSYSIYGYADAYVFAEGIRKAGQDPTRDSFIKGLEETRGFVAGDGKQWPFALPIAVPRSFTPTDHVGNHDTRPLVMHNGNLVPVSGYTP